MPVGYVVETVWRRRDKAPFYKVAIVFVAAFGTLAISFWPYMIPYSSKQQDVEVSSFVEAFAFHGPRL